MVDLGKKTFGIKDKPNPEDQNQIEYSQHELINNAQSNQNPYDANSHLSNKNIINNSPSNNSTVTVEANINLQQETPIITQSNNEKNDFKLLDK